MGRWAHSSERPNPSASELVLESYEHLLDRYNQFEDNRHEMGLAVIRLSASQ